MTILDQSDRWTSIDPKSMYSLVASFPEQVRSVIETGRYAGLPDGRKIGAIVLTGLGGSAIAGDLVRVIAGRSLQLPFFVNRDYEMPSFLNSSSLVIACSYSGNTEETLSAYQQAKKANAAIVCVTSGGRLEDLAQKDRVPVLNLPGGLPPRAALGYSLMTVLRALETMQLLPNLDAAVQEAMEVITHIKEQNGLRPGALRLESDNPAKQIAESLAGTIVAVYGSSAMMDAVAFRWRSQIEENAKNLAFHHALPEMNHNELVGWRYPEDVLRRVGVILLRDKEDHPQVQRRFDLTREIIAGKSGALHEIWSQGNSRLARVLSCLYLGDFVSLYMAYLNSTDPTPVEVIDYLKNQLGKAG